jgi:Fe-S cluster assembly ATPase SufC
MNHFTIIHDENEYQCTAVVGSNPKGKSVIFEIIFGPEDIRKVTTYLQITNLNHMLLASREPDEILKKGIELFIKYHFLTFMESGKTELEIPML